MAFILVCSTHVPGAVYLAQTLNPRRPVFADFSAGAVGLQPAYNNGRPVDGQLRC